MRLEKKFAAVLLSLMMVAAMSVSAFAAGTGEIIVDNPSKDAAYTAYKIFDAAYDTKDDGSAGTHYSYTIEGDSKWFSTVEAYAKPENGLKLEQVTGTSTYFAVVTDDKFSAPAFAEALKAATAEAEIVATGIELKDEDGVMKASGLELGYYFVTSSGGALCNLTTTNPSVTIHDKNEVTFEKIDDKDSVEIGDEVKYTITGKVPDTTGFTAYTYKISDTMSEGLTLQKGVTVTIGGTDVTGSCPLSYTPDNTNPTGFELTIQVMNYQDKVGAAISVTYSAVVNEKAIAKIEKNKATLIYSNDPTDEKKTGERTDEEDVYSAKIVIDKYAANPKNPNDTSGARLAGAKFVLYKEEPTGGTKFYYHYHNKDASVTGDIDKVEWFTLNEIIQELNKKNQGVTGWTDLPTDAKLEDVLALGEAAYGEYITSKTTGINGAAEFAGLKDGTYFLFETEAPKGYNPLKDAHKITIKGTDDQGKAVPAQLIQTAEVANNTGAELPSTGGTGTTAFYAVGGVLVLAAAVLLVVKRRMREEE